MGDISIQCVECGRPFIWSSGEQEFFYEHGLQPPKHCKACLAHRRVEYDGRNRDLAGPPVARIALNADAESAPTQGQSTSLILLPLWRRLRHAHEMRLVSQFMHLDLATVPTLDVETFSLLMQWMFEQFERETLAAEAQPACLDLRLHDSVEHREEFAHIYLGRPAGPPDSIYDLLDRLASDRVSRIYLCTFSSLTPHQRDVGRQAPVTIDLLEGEALHARLQEAQQRFRARLERARSMTAPGVAIYREVSITGEISSQARPYYAKKTPS